MAKQATGAAPVEEARAKEAKVATYQATVGPKELARLEAVTEPTMTESEVAAEL